MEKLDLILDKINDMRETTNNQINDVKETQKMQYQEIKSISRKFDTLPCDYHMKKIIEMTTTKKNFRWLIGVVVGLSGALVAIITLIISST